MIYRILFTEARKMAPSHALDTLIDIKEASRWASDFLNREISPTNISYLIQYGKIKKYGEN